MADVYPVYSGPNVQFIPGVPAVERLGITEEEADALVATGAFTRDKPPKAKSSPKAPETPGPSDSEQE